MEDCAARINSAEASFLPKASASRAFLVTVFTLLRIAVFRAFRLTACLYLFTAEAVFATYDSFRRYGDARLAGIPLAGQGACEARERIRGTKRGGLADERRSTAELHADGEPRAELLRHEPLLGVLFRNEAR